MCAARGQLDAPALVSAGMSVLQRLVVHLVLGEPAAGGVMQRRDAIGVIAMQTAPQEVEKQDMIAIPLMMAVEWLDEELRALQYFEQRLPVRDPEQRIAEIAIHAIDDRA